MLNILLQTWDDIFAKNLEYLIRFNNKLYLRICHIHILNRIDKGQCNL